MAYLDGRPTTLFHDEPGVEDGEGRWAPDGSAFFFQGSDGEGQENTYRRNSDGTVDLLKTGGSLPLLSADGRTYLFLSREISSQLWLMEGFR
jgi:Tol biopolymer transport system component